MILNVDLLVACLEKIDQIKPYINKLLHFYYQHQSCSCFSNLHSSNINYLFLINNKIYFFMMPFLPGTFIFVYRFCSVPLFSGTIFLNST